MTISLHIADEQGAVRMVPIVASLSVGRSPDSDLVVPDPEVSWDHCALWLEHGIPWVRDLDSRNGTFVDDVRIGRATPLRDGSVLRVGGVVATVRGALPALASRVSLALRDLDTGVLHPLRSDRFVIGPSEGNDLRIHHHDDVTLLVHPQGEVFCGDDELAIDVEHRIGPLRFRVEVANDQRQATVESRPDRYPYRVEARLDGPVGPTASVIDALSGRSHRLEAENRAIVLYVLAKRWVDDAEAGIDLAVRGWCPDDDLIVGIWGRGGLADGGGRLKALLHRVRSEIREAGLDPWFIEKRRGHTRVRVDAAIIGG